MQWYSGKGLDTLLERDVNTVSYDTIVAKPDIESRGGVNPRSRSGVWRAALVEYALSHLGEPWTLEQVLPTETLTRFQKLNYLDDARSEMIKSGYSVICKKVRFGFATYTVDWPSND